MATKVKTGVIDSSAITSALIANASITADDLHTTLDLTGKTVTVSTASAGDNDTSVASTAYVDVAIANLADSAPSTLNTLNELAAALGDDANYATTTTAAIAGKLPLAGGTMTGLLTVGAKLKLTDLGNATVAALQLTDSGLGISSPSTDQMNFITADTTRMVIGASGDVTVPGKILVNTDIRLGSEGVRLSSDGNGEFGVGYGQTATNSRFTVYNNTTAAFRVLPNGNVGIGTSSPTGYRLVVENTSEDLLKLHNSTDGLDSLISFTNPGGTLGRVQGIDNGGLGFDVGNNAGGIISNAMSIDNTANVGIGVTDPDTKLEVKGTSAAPSATAQILSVTNTTGGTRLDLGVAENSYGWIQAREGGTLRNLLLNSAGGNVGIGTDTPDLTLDVSHATASEYVATFQNTGSNLQLKIGTEPNDGGYLNIQGARVDNGNPYNLSLQSEGGSVGIGVSDPDSKLEIKGAGGSSGLTFKTTDASSNETFFCMDGGRVGVRYGPLLVGIPSSTAPDSGVKLQVNSSTGSALKVMSTETSGIAQVVGGLSVGRGNQGETDNMGCRVVGWYNANAHSSSSYLHIVTSLWGGGSPHGNNDYIMGGWEITGHSYATNASHGKCNVFFHNWSGSVASGYSLSYTGAFTGFALVYVNSSGYVTIRLAAGSYKGYWLDLFQAAHYPMRTVKVTAATFSNSTTL